MANFYSGKYCFGENYLVYGDQVQLDASFLKWKGWAALLGFESSYRLDRLSGRYRSIEDQEYKKKKYHKMTPELVFDDFIEPNLRGESNWIVDSIYGSSVYVDIDSSRIYTIYKTEDALVAKSETKLELNARNRITAAQVNNACLKESGMFGSIAKWINNLFVNILSES